METLQTEQDFWNACEADFDLMEDLVKEGLATAEELDELSLDAWDLVKKIYEAKR